MYGQTVVARHFGRPTFDVAPPRSSRRHLRHVDNRQTFLLQKWAWHPIGNNGGPLCLTPPKPNSQDLSRMRTVPTDLWGGVVFRSQFCSRTHRFRDIGWGNFSLTMEKSHRGTLAHFCHAPSDVILSAHTRGTPPVKVIRRNSHFFDCRQRRHIDIEAHSKRDQQTNKQKKQTHLPLHSPHGSRDQHRVCFG
jgi:hypothetical protein